MARELVAETKEIHAQREIALRQLEGIGALSHAQLELRKRELEREIVEQEDRLEREKVEATAALETMRQQVREAHKSIVMTDDLAMLQEVGIYQYRHPLTDVVAYESALANIEDKMKVMAKKDGGAVLATTDWTVNGSAKDGRAMVRDFSKLMLRAFNAEADTLVRGLKPYKLASTTLADLLTLLLVANPFSAMWASFRRWSSDELDDGLAYGWQGWLRRWPVDSFFPALLLQAVDVGGRRRRSSS